MEPKFAVGDRVVWTHKLGALFGRGAVLTRAAVLALDPQAVVGTISAVANESGTYFGVTFSADEIARVAAFEWPTHVVPETGAHVLTSDELVKVEG